jgi:hypothetical protein
MRETGSRGGPSVRHPDPMEPEQNRPAFILASQVTAAAPGATVRPSDSHGPDAGTDPRLHEQLAIIAGRRLSQFSIGINGTRLAFWGEAAGTVSREVFIEHPTMQLALPGKPAIACDLASDAAAAALLSVLNRRASQIAVTGGQLAISFETGLTLRVDPDQCYESWQISSDDGLLIICTPGGDLTIWYPPSGLRYASG